jgi:hypothetical protein
MNDASYKQVTAETLRSFHAATAAFVEYPSPRTLVIFADDVDGVMIFDVAPYNDVPTSATVWDWDLDPCEIGAGSFEAALTAVWSCLPKCWGGAK